MEMHFATVWESIADAIPDATGGRPRRPARLTWREYDDRAARLAAALTAAGLGPDSKVGLYLYNGNEYLEAQFAGVQDARRAGQRQLPLPRRGAVVPARQRRRRGAGVPLVARRPGRARAPTGCRS